MRLISRYIISLLSAVIIFCTAAIAQDQPADTVVLPLNIRVGADIAGPVLYLTDRNNLNLEGYFSIDLGAGTGFFFGAGFSDFRYSQYNYEYLSHGIFVKTGVDFNFFKPDKAAGKYWAGIGIRYGLSSYTDEIPVLKHDSYWGNTSITVPPESHFGHFLELAPGFRAVILKNFTMGWSLNIKTLIHPGTTRDMRPVHFAGYGNGNESLTFGINYHLSWNIPYRKIKVFIKPEEPPGSEEPGEEVPVEEADDLPSLFIPAENP